MSVDVFGRNLKQSVEQHGSRLPAISFKLTSESDYDIDNKRLCQIAEPIDSADAVTLETLNINVGALLNSFTKKWEKLNVQINELKQLSSSYANLDVKINELREQQLSSSASYANQWEKLVQRLA
ncbi:hypothetical protein TKK_0011585 [Trichogramma kaykai]